jgi:hypothetical protein
MTPGDQAAFRDQGRMHALLDAIFGFTGNAQVFDGIAKLNDIFHVCRGYFGDALGTGFAEIQWNAKGDR